MSNNVARAARLIAELQGLREADKEVDALIKSELSEGGGEEQPTDEEIEAVVNNL